MTKTSITKKPSLVVIISGAVLVTLILVLFPGMTLTKSTIEKRLVDDSIDVLKQTSMDWAERLNDKFILAEESIRRFSEIISKTHIEITPDNIREFDQLIKPFEDGSWRSDPRYFSAENDAGIWIQKGHPLTDYSKCFFIRTKKITDFFAKGSLSVFVDTWILPKEGGIVIYWPTEPEWIYGAAPDLDYTATEWVTLTKPDVNAEGLPRWTSTSFDPAPEVWMISVVAPFKRQNEWAGAVGHDLPISSLMKEVGQAKVYPNSGFILARQDGVLLMSSDFQDKIIETKGRLKINEIGDHSLTRYFYDFSRSTVSKKAPVIKTDEENGRMVVFSRIDSPKWFFITLIPREEILKPIRSAYKTVWVLIAFILFSSVVLTALVVSQIIVTPVKRLLKGTRSVAEGDLDYGFYPERSSEFNLISRSIGTMVAKLKTTLEDVRDAKERFQSLVANIPETIYRAELEAPWLTKHISENVFHLTGCHADSFIKGESRYGDFIHPEDFSEVEKKVRQGILNHHDFNLMYRIIHANGGIHWVQERGRAVYDDLDNPMWLDGIIIDISRQKEMEDELRKSNLLLTAVMEGTTDAIFVKDINGCYLLANEATLKAIGRPEQEVIGKTDSDLFPSDSVRVIQEIDSKVIESGKTLLAEERIESDYGDSFWLANKTPYRDPEGNIIGLIGISRNITDLKKTEEDKKNLEIRLQQSQKMEAIGTLAGGIAHDFNNILSIVLGYGEMAREEASPGSLLRKNLDEILKACLRAKDIVKQILTFSRMADTESVVFKPAITARETMKMIRASVPSTIRIHQDIDPASGSIMADPTKFDQILMNLCTNAYHAMEESGGDLYISLHNADLSKEDFPHESGIESGRFIELAVRDTGAGIASEMKNKIFEPYFTTKGTGKGTGMGLAIVYGIVKSYGGMIVVESELGRGTEFRVYLPAGDKEEIPEEDADTSFPEGKERVLFVDDEEMLTRMGKQMIEGLGYKVTTADGGAEALKLFQSRSDQFDLVITDQTMPGMTGDDLARRILRIRPDIPIILCTGYSSIVSEEKARVIGIREFVLKPISKREIARVLRNVLDGKT